VLQQTLGLWERDKVVIARGKINAKDRDGNMQNEVKILADDAREVTHEQAAAYQPTGKKLLAPKPSSRTATQKAMVDPSPPTQKSTRIYIRLLKSEDQELLLSLKRTIDEQQGESEVVLVLGREEAKQIVRLPARMKSDEEALKRIQVLVGPQNVILQ
jgi:hypothetical protein